MRIRLPVVSCSVIAVLAACGKPNPVANDAAAVNLPLPAREAAASPEGGPPESKEPPASPPAEVARIPSALQGRWGLTPADCTSALGDAKGLLVVNGSELRFYESRAVPSPGAVAGDDSIRGNFAFTGEGQSWTKFVRLERKGANLVRTESNPAASYTYAKC